MNEVLLNFASQLLLTVGVIVVFGLLISGLRKLFCFVAGNSGYWILLATGLVGTPVHELSHALMCVVFGHRIDAISLYSPGNPDGTLGYVQHSYNRRNLYHNIGHFFIGTAPIICGGMVLLLLMRWLVPAVYSQVAPSINDSFSMVGLDIGTVLGDYFTAVKHTAEVIFMPDNMKSAGWWIFIILAVMISSHMELSLSDILSGITGFIIISVLLFVADLIMWKTSPAAMVELTELAGGISLYLVGFLGLSVIFLTLMVAVALVCRLVFGVFFRR